MISKQSDVKLFMGLHNIQKIEQNVLNIELKLWENQIGLGTIER